MRVGMGGGHVRRLLPGGGGGGSLLPQLHLLPLVLLVVEPAQHPVIQPERSLLGGGGAAGVGEAVLVHDPVRLDPTRRPPGVEDERLLDPQRAAPRRDGLVGAGGLPVPVPGGAVGSGPVGVLAVPGREEVPLPGAEQRALRQVPRVELVQVHLRDDGHREALPRCLPAQVVLHQLVVRRVEPEPRR
uniref:NAC1 n=1 Tax=Arundo donax TaxID=35708 RepID=A0A0A9D3X3_ARUDO